MLSIMFNVISKFEPEYAKLYALNLLSANQRKWSNTSAFADELVECV